MTISWTEEHMLSIPEAARRLGKSAATLYAWIRRGVRGVHLESLCVGTVHTSEEALQRFFERTAPRQAPDLGPSQRELQRRADQALASLRRNGCKIGGADRGGR